MYRISINYVYNFDYLYSYLCSICSHITSTKQKHGLSQPPKPTLEWGVAVTTEVYGEGLVVARKPYSGPMVPIVGHTHGSKRVGSKSKVNTTQRLSIIANKIAPNFL